MSAPLSNGQKAHLAMLAKRAFNRAAAIARGAGDELAGDEDLWRHEEVAKACGKLGLRCCSQDDYKLVEGHFLNLLGETGKALKAFVHGATNDIRIVRFKIREACREFDLAFSYAEEICRSHNKGASIEDLSDIDRLWNVFYTVRNRGRARARKNIQTSTTNTVTT